MLHRRISSNVAISGFQKPEARRGDDRLYSLISTVVDLKLYLCLNQCIRVAQRLRDELSFGYF